MIAKRMQSIPARKEIEYSKDPDARWLKKGKRYHFEYKVFVTTDSEMKNLENALGNT